MHHFIKKAYFINKKKNIYKNYLRDNINMTNVNATENPIFANKPKTSISIVYLVIIMSVLNTTGKCVCEKGWNVTNTCTQIIGCISSHVHRNVTKCFACNNNQNFVFRKPNNCTCRQGYSLDYLTKKCKTTCGDGNFVAADEQCDDGNTYNEDGCSSICKIQGKFICYSTRYEISICKFKQDFSVSVYSLSRNFGESSFKLKLSFLPASKSLQFNPWQYNILTSPSQLQKKITYLSHYFQSPQVLVLQYSINQSIQNDTIKWVLGFDDNKFLSKDIQLNVQMKGMNAPLMREEYYKHERILDIFSYVLGGIVCAIALVSMAKAQSNIAFELATTTLFIYYSRLMSYQSNPAILYTFSGLRLSAGYNQFFPNQYLEYTEYPGKNRFFIKSELGLMIVFTLLLIMILLVLKMVLQLKSLQGVIFSQKLNMNEDTQEKKKEIILFKVLKQNFMNNEALDKKYVLPFTLISYYTIFAAFTGFENPGLQYQPFLDKNLTKMILFFFFLVVMYYAVISCSIFWKYFQRIQVPKRGRQPSGNIVKLTFKQKSSLYTELFLFYMLITSVLIFFTFDYALQQHNYNEVIETCFAVIISYIIIIALIKPYDDRLNMLSVVFNQFVKLLFLLFLWLIKKNILSQLAQLMGVYLFFFLTVTAIVLSILRVKNTWTSGKQEEQLLKEKLNQKLKQEKKKTMKKYVKNDKSNPYRYQNILKRQKEQQNFKDASFVQKFVINNNRNNLEKASRSGQNDGNSNNVQTSLYSQNSPFRVIDLGSKKSQGNNSSFPGSSTFDQGKDMLQLQRLKQLLRKSYNKMKTQKRQLDPQIYSKQIAQQTLKQYEEQLQKQYEPDLWRQNHPEKAQNQDRKKREERMQRQNKFTQKQRKYL